MMNAITAVLLAGLAMPAAAQLQPIDAGTILNQINNTHPFPTPPPPTMLDMCVFTEFKNNKCLFKCESGAILIEPAVRPDFSTGEPAGACATHIIRPIRPTFAQFRDISSSQLRDLLSDSDPEIRLAAVKSAKRHILNSYAQQTVLEIYKNGKERADIRVEAARTLSYASGSSRIQNAFTDLLKYGGDQPQVLRVMTYKALFAAAASSSRYQDFLMDAIKYDEKDPVARRAAIWGLFDSVRNSRPQGVLTELVKYGGEDDATKIEAIKSLYGAMGNYRVKDMMIDLVKYGDGSIPVRLAAIKALSGAKGDSSVRSLLNDMVRHESDARLRAAAIEASEPDMPGLREYFHLGYTLQNGSYVSPIEKE